MKHILVVFLRPVSSGGGCGGALFGLLFLFILGYAALTMVGTVATGALDYVSSPESSGPSSSTGGTQGGRVYRVSVVDIAKQLHEQQGYSVGKIRRYLKKQGYGTYKRRTIKEWLRE